MKEKKYGTKIAQLKEEIRKTPYHKGTEHYIGQLKAKIAKLKEKESQSKKGGSSLGFIPKKEGDATVVLVGPPSVGKSTLLNKITEAHSRVASWSFTTTTVIPGMLEYKGAKIQVFDLPGILGGAASGIGRGREVFSAVRAADLLILMVDVKTRHQINPLLKELRQAKINLPILIVINKGDIMKKIPNKVGENQVLVSAEKEWGLAELKEIIWQKLELMRIYLKPRWGQPDFSKPLILKKGQRAKDAFEKTFPEEKKNQQILLWGSSARFPGQQISLNHQLADEDILSFS